VVALRQSRRSQQLQFSNCLSRRDRAAQLLNQKEVVRFRYKRWRLAVWLAIGKSFFVLPCCAIAQLVPVPDNTLGGESTTVSPEQVINGLPINQIEGGAQRGSNLFHSFQEFNIDVGRGVYFANPADVINILTRVTGSNPSQILGTLGVLGNANLFLLNSNGILFGPNAQLDIGGSFVASTANGLLFDNGFVFSTTNPQAPPLLTVNVPIGLQYGSSPGVIQVQGSFLQVPDGQTLTLAGGVVNIDGAGLFAFGGRVELAGIAAPGEVRLTQQGQEWQLSVPDGLVRADVEIRNGAIVDVRADGGGSIAINARNLIVTGDGTQVRAGVGIGLGGIGVQAKNIDITTTEVINLDAGFIDNIVAPDGTGNAGNINITTNSLSLSKGAYIETATYGQGNAGNITITARDAVSFDGVGTFSSGAYSGVYGAIGQGGDINITTDRLSLTNGGIITAGTNGQGNAGNIAITAKNRVSFDGEGSNGSGSGAYNQVRFGAVGQAGDINITTGSLLLTNGASVDSSTFAQGDAGNITIVASERVFLAGERSDGSVSSASSYVGSQAIGQAGNINITTEALSVNEGAIVFASTFGQGDAGNITMTVGGAASFDGVNSNSSGSGAFSEVGPDAIGRGGNINITTETLSMTDGGGLSASTYGQGKGGNIIVTARGVVSIDNLNDSGFGSGIFSIVASQAVGGGGDIIISADSFLLTNGGVIGNPTFGQGNAGNITLIARERILFDGTTRNTLFTSGAGSTVGFGAIGRGGNISVTTGTLTITNGAALSATTFGQGDAGKITVTARDAVFIDGADSNGIPSGIFSRVGPQANGKGGGITINTPGFSITNSGELTASAEGPGEAGDLDITARQLRLNNQGSIQAQTASGQGGNIRLQIPDLLLMRRGSSISTDAGTAQAGGDGGNITFNGNFIVAVDAENSDISANAFTGNGGRVEINAQSLFGIQFRPQQTPLSDITASSTFGAPGVVIVETPDLDPNRGLVQLPADLSDASQLIAQTCPTGDGIAKQANEFIVTGRGGLPPTPSEAVNQDAIQVGLVAVDSEDGSSVSQVELVPNSRDIPSTIAPAAPIVEAQTWQRAADGTIRLVAGVPQNSTADFKNRRSDCSRFPLIHSR